MISNLEPHQVFVFGSNLAGNHIGGAAKQAREQFGAKEGIGEGLTGQCYAFPTLGKNMERRTDHQLRMSALKLFACAMVNRDKDFLLTKVGCGIAGYSEEYMMSIFRSKEKRPKNIFLPEDWI
jgi:hypothetical protein